MLAHNYTTSAKYCCTAGVIQVSAAITIMLELRATIPGHVPVADHARLIQSGGSDESPQRRIVVVVRIQTLARTIPSPRPENPTYNER